MINAAIIGGSGYVGGEILRLLLFHQKVKVIAVTSKSNVGKKVSDIHPNLNGICNLDFQEENIKQLTKKADLIFFALPHGLSMTKINQINFHKTKVIDLGADFRIKNIQLFEKTYGIKHIAQKLLKGAVYGLTEFNQDNIKKAKLVACPGCFPTGALLALLPIVKAGVISQKIIVDSKTGSSGSGANPSIATHHPERAFDVKAYNLFNHRHLPEIAETLNNLQKDSYDLIFTPHSIPIVRGIFTTAYVFLKEKISEDQIKEIYKKTYAHAPFIRIVESPRCTVVKGTNFCDLAINIKGQNVIITTAIDNLIKGAAGQAMQNMNLMFGFPETTGLEFTGLHP